MSDTLTKDPLSAPRRVRSSRRRRSRSTAAISLAAGLLSVLAPVTLTGLSSVDRVERALLVAGVSFVAAHGRRWSWMVAGALAAVSARGMALGFVFGGLAVATFSAWPKRRPKELGALSVGLIVNGLLWYPGTTPVLLPHALAVVALLIVMVSGFPELRSSHRRVAGWILAGLIVLTLIALGLAAYGVWTARNDVEAGTSAARRALASVRDGDTDGARGDLDEAKRRLTSAEKVLSGPTLLPVEAVPGASQQARAVRVSVRSAREVTLAAEALVSTDYDDLRYEGQIDLGRITDLRPRAEEVERTLVSASEDLAEISKPMLLSPLRSRVEDLTTEVDSARDDAEFAASALRVAPGLLGGDGPRRYFVAFLTPAELRGSGGFIGNWVELGATDGDVELTESGRIADLIDAAPPGTRTLDGPADYIARYQQYRPTDYLQDVTVTPNWPSAASVLAQLYPQSGGRPVDGVIGVDPTGIAALLDLVGPVSVPGLGYQLNAENAVPFLTTGQYQQFPDREERADVLEASIRATFEAVTDASLPSPRLLGDVLGPAARARHLQIWSPNDEEQGFFERIEADGTLVIPTGSDGFSVVGQNAGNNKIDAYLQRTVTYDTVIDASKGSISGTITVKLRNDVPSLDLGPAVVGNNRGVPVGTNLTSLTLFTPHLVRSASIDGAPITLAPGEEQGLRAWGTPLLSVPPNDEVIVVFDVEGTVDLSQAYSFRYLPQPLVNPDFFSLTAQVENGSLADDPPSIEQSGLAAENIEVRRRIER